MHADALGYFQEEYQEKDLAATLLRAHLAMRRLAIPETPPKDAQRARHARWRGRSGTNVISQTLWITIHRSSDTRVASGFSPSNSRRKGTRHFAAEAPERVLAARCGAARPLIRSHPSVRRARVSRSLR